MTWDPFVNCNFYCGPRLFIFFPKLTDRHFVVFVQPYLPMRILKLLDSQENWESQTIFKASFLKQINVFFPFSPFSICFLLFKYKITLVY
jgi:hypothetical protein